MKKIYNKILVGLFVVIGVIGWAFFGIAMMIFYEVYKYLK